jgi:hypothetical protein
MNIWTYGFLLREGQRRGRLSHLRAREGVMAVEASSKLMEVVKNTLEQLEQTEELRPDDRAMVELRSSILRTIVELEIARHQHPSVSA